MEDKKTLNFYIIVIGICIMIVGALGYSIPLLILKNKTLIEKYGNFIGPIIYVIGFFVFLVGLSMSFKLRTLNDDEKVKYNLSIGFVISIAIYIISLFFPYYTLDPDADHYGAFQRHDYATGLLGFLFFLISLLLLFYNKYKAVKILCPIGTVIMAISLIIDLMLWLYIGIPTFSLYLFLISIILNIIVSILTLKLPKTAKQEGLDIKKHLTLSKVAILGINIIMIAVVTLLINFIIPTSSSYAFILFLFPIEFTIGLIVLIIGLILSFLSKSGESS